MLLFHGTTPTPCSTICLNDAQTQLLTKRAVTLSSTRLTAGPKFAAVLAAAGAPRIIEVAAPQEPEETLSNIPQSLSSVCAPGQQDCKKRYKIQRPKSRKAEGCTSKCTATCMQGGFGSPGDGPFSMRRPLVVFKDGFRSRKYCLSECSDICNLIGDGDDGP
ncbi:uncharacterized protein LOC105159786 [Sesamum indicum]|uniref:Uncharacterized protein LOC105159786 n=1 Tax=Sesamum indicum TaxID=4182 RepID=A0A6I9SY47_SESIN|nr:uncharacterized protein LOC105159786 [Sesamum indicum]